MPHVAYEWGGSNPSLHRLYTYVDESKRYSGEDPISRDVCNALTELHAQHDILVEDLS